MGQHPATEAEPVTFATFAFVLYAAIALGRALSSDTAGTVLPSSVLESVLFVAAAVLLVVASALVYYRSYSAELAELERTQAEHARQAERNATIMAGSLLVASTLAMLVTALAAGGAVTWRDALATVAALGVVELVWYGASTIPYAPLPRAPPPT